MLLTQAHSGKAAVSVSKTYAFSRPMRPAYFQ